MILHTVNKPDCLARCLALIAPGDAVLLIEDGVYLAMVTAGNEARWSTMPDSTTCYALADDLAARGISDRMLPCFESATWQQFVALATRYDKVISWG